MNELQQKAIEQLLIKNEAYIQEIDELLAKIKKEYQKFDKFEKDFWNLMNDMEKAHSQLPYLPYSNAYYIKNGYFSVPTMPCLRDALYGTVNDGYEFLSEEYLNKIQSDISKNADLFKEKLSEMVGLISELLNRIIASNSITKRLSGLENKAAELEAKSKLFWYPIELSKNEYSFKGSIVVPLYITYPQLATPLHRQLMINYDYLFKSKALHIKILNDVKAILNYINEYLPFAELVPLKEDKGISIINTVTPKQVQIGSNNDFDGNINIGNEGDVEDDN